MWDVGWGRFAICDLRFVICGWNWGWKKEREGVTVAIQPPPRGGVGGAKGQKLEFFLAVEMRVWGFPLERRGYPY